MAKKSQSFEQSITRLDEIVRQLEQGNVPLEDALKLFQEGTALVDTCGKLLDKAELEDNLGTIAKSGSFAFKNEKEAKEKETKEKTG